jgi:hypothetical protein
MVLEYTAKTKTTLRNAGIGLFVGGVAITGGSFAYGFIEKPEDTASTVTLLLIGGGAAISITGTTLLILGSVAKVKKQ